MEKVVQRANLGCGRRILSGYLNVDLNPRADVVCDITALPEDWTDRFDEVLAVHVIEHIYPWDVEKTLLEWKRIIKPGGKIVIECPNLLKVASLFLEDPDKINYGMWGFYGDPSTKDPLMGHKWGYIPKSLIKLLRAAGFVDVEVKPAQYHVAKRDMRVEAIKSGVVDI